MGAFDKSRYSSIYHPPRCKVNHAEFDVKPLSPYSSEMPFTHAEVSQFETIQV